MAANGSQQISGSIPLRSTFQVLFNTTTFAIFFAIVLALYLPLQRWPRAQNALLLAASYVFYGWWDWRFLGLLWLSTAIDYLVALGLERRRWLIAVSLVVQLGILVVFKYLGFFGRSLAALATALGLEVSQPTLDLVLPVGVSFYTFQSLSYTIDVYRGVIPPERRPLEFACFVALFPQLVAGPIERARNMLPQIAHPRAVTLERVYEGSWLVLWGLYKKVFIADNLAPIVEDAFNRSATLSRLEALVALYAFAFQIYCDFAGYTDIARGVAKILGFDFQLNFRRPYLALDPSDFWRRWHISLSSWLRDYLYVSLGGNRGSTARTYRNLMLTMLLGGLWHGASWTFVLWGCYHGALLVAYRLVPGATVVAPDRPARGLGLIGRIARAAILFHLVLVSWLLFRATSVEQVGDFVGALLHGGGDVALSWRRALVVYAAPLFVYELGEELWPSLPFALPAPLRGAVYFAVIMLVAVAGAPSGKTFIYFQF